MVEIIRSYGGSAFVVLGIFCSLVLLVRWGVLVFIEEKIPKEMPKLLRWETMSACRKRNNLASFCFFVSSSLLASAWISFCLWHEDSTKVSLPLSASFYLFGSLIFLGNAAYIKGMSLWKIYKRAIELNQMSRFIGEMTHLRVTARLWLTLSGPVASKDKRRVDFMIHQDGFSRYQQLLIDGEVMVFFTEISLERDPLLAERFISHVIATGYQETEYHISTRTSKLMLVQK